VASGPRAPAEELAIDAACLEPNNARTASGRQFSFPWIVAPAKPSAPLAVLASNITWNAYNSFGGRSNYIHADQMPATPTVNARFEQACHLAPDEWRLVVAKQRARRATDATRGTTPLLSPRLTSSHSSRSGSSVRR